MCLSQTFDQKGSLHTRDKADFLTFSKIAPGLHSWLYLLKPLIRTDSPKDLQRRFEGVTFRGSFIPGQVTKEYPILPVTNAGWQLKVLAFT